MTSEQLCDPSLLFENTQLPETAHPILVVPGSDDLPIFELVDIDNLNVHLPVLWRKTHELPFLSASHTRADDYFVTILENVLDGQLQIRKRRGELREQRFHTFWTGPLTGRSRNINPVLVQNFVDE